MKMHVHAHVSLCMCRGTRALVRRQHKEVGSILPSCGFWGKLYCWPQESQFINSTTILNFNSWPLRCWKTQEVLINIMLIIPSFPKSVLATILEQLTSEPRPVAFEQAESSLWEHWKSRRLTAVILSVGVLRHSIWGEGQVNVQKIF